MNNQGQAQPPVQAQDQAQAQVQANVLNTAIAILAAHTNININIKETEAGPLIFKPIVFANQQRRGIVKIDAELEIADPTDPTKHTTKNLYSVDITPTYSDKDQTRPENYNIKTIINGVPDTTSDVAEIDRIVHDLRDRARDLAP